MTEVAALPIPDDLAEHINESLIELRRRYGRGNSTLYRWFAKMADRGITRAPEAKSGPPPMSCPDDFMVMQEGKSINWLAKHYGISRATISNLLRRQGMENRVLTPPIAAKPPKPFKPFGISVSPRGTIPPHRPHRDDSRAGLAAAYLQPDYIPTYRCNAEGRQDIAGRFWRCGRRVAITDAAIIELAESVRERKSRRWAA